MQVISTSFLDWYLGSHAQLGCKRQVARENKRYITIIITLIVFSCFFFRHVHQPSSHILPTTSNVNATHSKWQTLKPVVSTNVSAEDDDYDS